MNKASRVAIERFNKMKQSDKTYVTSKVLITNGYKHFLEKNKSRSDGYYIPHNYLIYFLTTHYEANTINGRRRVKQASFEEDRLQLITTWLPNGQFAPSGDGSYTPLGHNEKCTEMMLPFVRKAKESYMIKEWSKIKHALCSKSFGKESKYSQARLDYEPKYDDTKDVYFVLDSQDGIVKIGVSHNINQRLHTIKRDYNTGELDVLCVIKSGGITIEKLLHNHFAHIQFSQEGKGREWFKYNEEMSVFITELNSHPIKSKLIDTLVA